jgi:hypothetical protein
LLPSDEIVSIILRLKKIFQALPIEIIAHQFFSERETYMRRVFQEITALWTNARAIVTKRQSFNPEMTPC